MTWHILGTAHVSANVTTTHGRHAARLPPFTMATHIEANKIETSDGEKEDIKSSHHKNKHRQLGSISDGTF